jgi:hypothetical protein
MLGHDAKRKGNFAVRLANFGLECALHGHRPSDKCSNAAWTVRLSAAICQNRVWLPSLAFTMAVTQSPPSFNLRVTGGSKRVPNTRTLAIFIVPIGRFRPSIGMLGAARLGEEFFAGSLLRCRNLSLNASGLHKPANRPPRQFAASPAPQEPPHRWQPRIDILAGPRIRAELCRIGGSTVPTLTGSLNR